MLPFRPPRAGAGGDHAGSAAGRRLANVAKLSTRPYRRLTYAVSYGIAEDGSPPPGKKQLDTTLTVAFETTF